MTTGGNDLFEIKLEQYVYWEEKKQFLLEVDTDIQWISYLVEKGSFEYKIGGKQGVAHSGEIILCPPYTKFYREIRESLTFHFFRFSIEEEQQHLLTQFTEPILVVDRQRTLSNANILKRLAYDTSTFSVEYQRGLLKDLLMSAHLEKNDISINQLGIAYQDPIIKKAIFLLSQSIGEEEVSINEIANTLSINRSYLSKKFKSVTNTTPVEYRNRLRIRKAQKMLIETDCTLEIIAEKCNFSSGFYLSRIFSKYIGICPSQYRAMHKI